MIWPTNLPIAASQLILFFQLGLRFVQQTAFNSQATLAFLAQHHTNMDALIGFRKPGMGWTKR